MRTLTSMLAMILCSVFATQAADYEVVYKKTEQADLHMTILTPEDVKPNDKLPAVVFFHGGSWASGSRASLSRQAEYLRSRGIVTVNVEYRLRNTHKTTPIECVMDAKSAIRYVRSNATTYNIDPDKIISSGGSAGGHLAAAVTMCPKINDPKDNLKVSSKVSALLLFNPVACNGPETSGAYRGYGYNRIKAKVDYKDFSPMHNINSSTPPVLFLLGDKDNLIPVAQAQEFKRLVEEKGGRCDVKIYKDCGHAFFNIKGLNAKYFHQTLSAIDDFLVSLGYLNGEGNVGEWLKRQNAGFTY